MMMILRRLMKGKSKIKFKFLVLIFKICSSSKGNSEEETNSNSGDQFVDCVISTTFDEIKSNDDEPNEKVNGIEEEKEDKSKEAETKT